MKNFIPAIFVSLFIFGGNISYVYSFSTYTQTPTGTEINTNTVTFDINTPELYSICLAQSYDENTQIDPNATIGYFLTTFDSSINPYPLLNSPENGKYLALEKPLSSSNPDNSTFSITLPTDTSIYQIFPFCNSINVSYNVDLYYDEQYERDLILPPGSYINGTYIPLVTLLGDLPTPTSTPTSTLSQNDLDQQQLTIFILIFAIYLMVIFSLLKILEPFRNVRK